MSRLAQGDSSRGPVRKLGDIWSGSRITLIGFCALGGFVAALTHGFVQRVGVYVIFWAALGVSYQVIAGTAGQVFLGPNAFVGIGAFTDVILGQHVTAAPWIALLGAPLVGACIALVIGLITLRLTGIYFSLATLVLPLLLVPIFVYFHYVEVLSPSDPHNEWVDMTWANFGYYAIPLGGLLLCGWLIRNLVERSSLGLSLRIIRADENIARSVGVAVMRAKVIAFVIAAALSSALGVVYAQMLYVVTPDSVFGLSIIVTILLVVLLGGVRSTVGPLIGAAIVVPLTMELDSSFGASSGASSLALGVVLAAIVLLLPRGLMERCKELAPALRRRWGSWDRATSVEPCGTGEDDGEQLGERSQAERTVSHHKVSEPKPFGLDSVRPEAAGSCVLEVTGLTKEFGGLKALSNVEMRVDRGEFLGVCGPNGAGKSTLFDIISGYQHASRGHVALDGHNISHLPPEKIAIAGIRRTFQHSRLVEDLSAPANVAIGTNDRFGARLRYYADSGPSTLRYLGIDPSHQSSSSHVSPAMARLIEVGRVVASPGSLLLLDEPLAGLTADEARTVMRLLREQAGAGRTVVVIDHNIGIVSEFVRRLIVMIEGQIAVSGSPDEVVRHPVVQAGYIGKQAHAPT